MSPRGLLWVGVGKSALVTMFNNLVFGYDPPIEGELAFDHSLSFGVLTLLCGFVLYRLVQETDGR
jgi:hypothetical protein